MTYLQEILIFLTKKLLPSGRVWRMPDNGIARKFHEAIALSEERLYTDCLAVLDSILPDNPNFTEDDATAWERRLGLIISLETPLEDRKLAIARKIQHPGTQKPRQHYLYIQEELRKAGFDVYVYENRFPDGFGGYETKTPQEVAISQIGFSVQHGQSQHGQKQHGSIEFEKIVNSLDSFVDALFDVGDNFKSTFFISSSTLGLNAVILESRMIEFRQLVLKLKPAQTVCYPFITFEPLPVNKLELEDDNGFVLLEDGSFVLLEDSLI